MIKMKYFTIFIISLCLHSLPVQGQSVYNMVLDNATRIVNSPSSSYTQTQIAQFKRTALIYLKSKAFEQNDSVSTEFLNVQAYYLSEFLSSFFKNILEHKSKDNTEKEKLIKHYMDASVMNPLYNDNDQLTTMSYIIEGGQLTPFCLNTDWQKAFQAISKD